MRRIFIFAVLLLMSVQMSWAAVSSYCQHESGAAAQHFGHHEHEHDASRDTSKVPSQFVIDDDCASCQLGSLGILPQPVGTLRFDVGLIDTTRFTSSYLPSARSDRPERPKWMRAV